MELELERPLKLQEKERLWVEHARLKMCHLRGWKIHCIVGRVRF